MAKKNTKSGAKKSEKKAPAGDSRPTWRGFSASAVVRYAGSKGMEHDKAVAILDKMKFGEHSTFYSQIRKGKAGEGVPVFSKEDRAEFNKIAESIPAVAPKPRAEKAEKAGKKAAKPEKKAGKKAGKKSKAPAMDPEDALDDAAAAAEAVAEDADEE